MNFVPLPPPNTSVVQEAGAPSIAYAQYLASLDAIVRNRNFVGTFTRDLSLASGNQSITGVGFQPSAVAFIMGIVGGNKFASIGFGSLTSSSAIEFFLTTTDTFFQPNIVGIVRTAAGNFDSAALASFDADGFTLTFTKTGAPVGTLTCGFLAFH